MNKFTQFCKKEIVFCIAACAAIITCFFVKPSSEYLKYIDWNTLALLFSLMTVVAGLRRCDVFDKLGSFLISKVKSIRSLCAVFVFLCFFLSMFITNDVSLITFVPFSISVLLSMEVPGTQIMYTVVLQTVAANVGSMLTPIGNPQNLFLFSKMNVSLASFIKILLPYTIISFVLLVISVLFVPKGNRNKEMSLNSNETKITYKKQSGATTGLTVVYLVLFVTSILSVLGVFPKWIAALATLILVGIVDRKTFFDVDYMLLLTFVAFFIFTGNIQHLSIIKQMLERVVQNHECIAAIIASQIISNVPAALLLYPFSKNVEGLLCGVDIGGLGTLVASLASLISFKIYTENIHGQKTGKLPSTMHYLGVFTLVNILFLAVMVTWYCFA